MYVVVGKYKVMAFKIKHFQFYYRLFIVIKLKARYQAFRTHNTNAIENQYTTYL